MSELFKPPRPKPLWAIASLARTIWQGDGDLLSLMPANAYKFASGHLGYSRRSILLFNEPETVRQILVDPEGIFPKSDLMVNALEPLIGDSVFVTYGETWRRQRKMIEPAFSQLRISSAFTFMQQAVEKYTAVLDEYANSGKPFSLDQVMSELTADIICRTIFSTPFDPAVADEFYEDFANFERSVAQVEIKRLITEPAWTKPPQQEKVLSACKRMRGHIGAMIDTHLGNGEGKYDDIASAVIAARDEKTGKGLTRDELINQLGVFFLAGHETTASALIWLFYILSVQPDVAERVRSEVISISGEDAISFDHTKKMPVIRSVFKEALRLYPPVTFLPRVAERTTRMGNRNVRRGALVMISPWTLHRHTKIWENPDHFDPCRFMPENESRIPKGAYIPFGGGPHTCIGAGFAMVESALIIASLMRRYRFKTLDPHSVRPAARLTTRPAKQIMVQVTRHE